MPGFFSSSVANKLIEQSNHFLDWSRVGNLLSSGTHRYSSHELVQRGIVIGAMGAGAFVGVRAAQDAGMSSGLYGMAGCFVGFVVSHMVVIAPLVYKRVQRSAECFALDQQCKALIKDIEALDSDNPQLAELMIAMVQAVESASKINLSDEKQGNASRTWGRRLTLMEAIEQQLHSDLTLLSENSEQDDLLFGSMVKAFLTFWTQPKANLHQLLMALPLDANEKVIKKTESDTQDAPADGSVVSFRSH